MSLEINEAHWDLRSLSELCLHHSSEASVFTSAAFRGLQQNPA